MLVPDKTPQVRVLAQPFLSEPGRSANLNPNSGSVTFGQAVDVCFNGMGGGPVSVSVHGPDGFAMGGVLPRLPASLRNGSEWLAQDWVPAIEPSWPLGRYAVSARSGAVGANSSFTVVPARETGVRVLGPSTDPGHNAVSPDSHATVFLTGFRKVHSLTLTTYYQEGIAGHGRFFSSARVPIPPSGNTMLQIPTGPKSTREPTFIITARSQGVTLLAPFVLESVSNGPGLIVGALPQPTGQG